MIIRKLGAQFEKCAFVHRKFQRPLLFSEEYKMSHNRVFLGSVQFSHSVVSDSLRPHESLHARPPCPSPSPRVHSDSLPLSPWCHPAISCSVVPFSCPRSLLLGRIWKHFWEAFRVGSILRDYVIIRPISQWNCWSLFCLKGEFQLWFWWSFWTQ